MYIRCLPMDGLPIVIRFTQGDYLIRLNGIDSMAMLYGEQIVNRLDILSAKRGQYHTTAVWSAAVLDYVMDSGATSPGYTS